MKKEMLINVRQSEECRIAIIENGVLEELYVDRTSHETYSGNIYKGRIVNLEPAIQAAFVDFSIGRVESLQICQNLRRNPEFAETILIALLPDDGSSTSFDRSSINETFKKPFDASLLAERVRTLIGARKELV